MSEKITCRALSCTYGGLMTLIQHDRSLGHKGEHGHPNERRVLIDVSSETNACMDL